MRESILKEKSLKELRIGDLVIVNHDDEQQLGDFVIVININLDMGTILVFDCYNANIKSFNVGEYINFLYVDVNNIINTKEYLETLER